MPTEVFDRALADLRLRLPLAQTILVLYGEGEEMPVQAAHGMSATDVWSTAPISLTVLRKARATGEPVFFRGNQDDPELAEVTSLVVAGIRAVMCVPLRDGTRKVRGLLYADQRHRQETFDNKDLARVIQVGRDLERKLDTVAWSEEQSRPHRPPRPRPVAPSSPPVNLPVKFPSRSRVLLLRGLATMLGSSISIARSLTFLSGQTEEPGLGEVSRRLLTEVERGKRLSAAMQNCGPACFGAFCVRLVRVGEETGTLSDVLGDVAAYEEKVRELGMRLRSKLTYPVLLFAFCLAMLVVLPPLAIRGPLKAMTDMGQETPWITQAVVAVSGFLGSPVGMLAILAALVGGGLGLGHIYRRPGGRLWLQERLLAMGPLGQGVRLLTVTRFAVALALLLRSGVGVLKALPHAVATTDDAVLESRLPAMLESITAGSTLTQALQASGYFPSAFVAVLAAGEESAKLDRTLPWIAGIYEVELESKLDIACAALEPLLMLGMGVTAAIIALAVMLPLVKLTQSL